MTTLAHRTPGTPQTRTPRPPPGRIRWWEPISGAIRPATSLIGVSSGKRVVGQAHRLVGDGRVARGHQRLGAGQGGGQVEVGEEDLALAQAQTGVLLGRRLLDPEDHVRGRPDVVGVGHQGGPGGDEVLVGDGRADPGALLHVDRVPGGRELAHPGGGDGHPVLVVLHLLGHADDHRDDLTPRSTGRPRAAACRSRPRRWSGPGSPAAGPGSVFTCSPLAVIRYGGPRPPHRGASPVVRHSVVSPPM